MSQPTGAASGGVGGGTVGDFQLQLASAAGDRAATWDAVADVLDLPDLARTERLRAGEHAEVWLRHCRWLGPDSDVLAAPVTTLQAYARSSRRRDAADDLAALDREHAAHLGGAGAGLAAHARAVAASCRTEAELWTAGEMAAGKAERARQREIIDAELVPGVVPAAAALVREAEARVWRTLGRVLLAVLSVETGTDHRVE